MGQLMQESRHLLRMPSVRNRSLRRQRHVILVPQCHPLFRPVPGTLEPKERGK
jgi:hypothetical protein